MRCGNPETLAANHCTNSFSCGSPIFCEPQPQLPVTTGTSPLLLAYLLVPMTEISWAASLCLCLASSRLRLLIAILSFKFSLPDRETSSGMSSIPSTPSLSDTPTNDSLRVRFSKLPANCVMTVSRRFCCCEFSSEKCLFSDSSSQRFS